MPNAKRVSIVTSQRRVETVLPQLSQVLLRNLVSTDMTGLRLTYGSDNVVEGVIPRKDNCKLKLLIAKRVSIVASQRIVETVLPQLSQALLRNLVSTDLTGPMHLRILKKACFEEKIIASGSCPMQNQF